MACSGRWSDILDGVAYHDQRGGDKAAAQGEIRPIAVTISFNPALGDSLGIGDCSVVGVSTIAII
jgi:hypothetical protein